MHWFEVSLIFAIIYSMNFSEAFNDHGLISMVVFAALLGVLFCAMPNLDSMHRMPQQCSMSNFYSALPPQASNKLVLWFTLLISTLLIFGYSKLLGTNGLANTAPRLRLSKAQIAISKIFDFLIEKFRRGIIHPKIYSSAFSF